RVGEGNGLRRPVEQEVEGIDGPDLQRQLHQQLERLDPRVLAKGDPGYPVAVGILLPAQLGCRGDVEPVALDPRPGVVRRAEPDEVWPETGRAGVAVAASVLDEQAHGDGLSRTSFPASAPRLLWTHRVGETRNSRVSEGISAASRNVRRAART